MRPRLFSGERQCVLSSAVRCRGRFNEAPLIQRGKVSVQPWQFGDPYSFNEAPLIQRGKEDVLADAERQRLASMRPRLFSGERLSLSLSCPVSHAALQ